jgi:hypothetical protein
MFLIFSAFLFHNRRYCESTQNKLLQTEGYLYFEVITIPDGVIRLSRPYISGIIEVD